MADTCLVGIECTTSSELKISKVEFEETLFSAYQVIPSHGNPQMRWTLFDGYLFKYCSVKYQTFHQVSEKTSQQTYSHQKTTWKAFQMPQRAIKHQLTCPIELASGSFLIGRRGILVIPRNRTVNELKWEITHETNLSRFFLYLIICNLSYFWAQNSFPNGSYSVN